MHVAPVLCPRTPAPTAGVQRLATNSNIRSSSIRAAGLHIHILQQLSSGTTKKAHALGPWRLAHWWHSYLQGTPPLAPQDSHASARKHYTPNTCTARTPAVESRVYVLQLRLSQITSTPMPRNPHATDSYTQCCCAPTLPTRSHRARSMRPQSLNPHLANVHAPPHPLLRTWARPCCRPPAPPPAAATPHPSVARWGWASPLR